MNKKTKIRNDFAKQKNILEMGFVAIHTYITEELCLKRVHMRKTMPHAF